MKIKHIDHIGVAVMTIEQSGKFYTDILGLKIKDIENVAEQKVNVAFIPITDSEVELLESTHAAGPVAKHIDSKGEGVQHRVSGGKHRRGSFRAQGQRGSPDRRETKKRRRRGTDSLYSPQGAKRRIDRDLVKI